MLNSENALICIEVLKKGNRQNVKQNGGFLFD